MPERPSLVERIERDFSFHYPSDKKAEQHADLRTEVKELAYYIAKHLPEGREQSLAITALEEALFWGNAAIARA